MTKASILRAAVITLMMTLMSIPAHSQDMQEIIDSIESQPLRVADTLTMPRRVKAEPIKAFFDQSDNVEKVIVGNDTVSVILPSYNLGRYDRGLYNYLFIPKGQWAVGLTAGYGEFSADDVQILSILKDFNFRGKQYSLSPEVSYFFRNNQSIGVRFNYNRGEGDLSGLTVDIDDDMNFSLRDVSYRSQKYGLALFYRNYIGLGTMKRFGIFNEVEVAFNNGSQSFSRIYNDKPKLTRTTTTGASLNFSPGVTVYIMDYVSFNVAIGVFGFSLQQESQVTDGVDEGHRFSTGANFKLNLFNIKFGASVNF